MKKKTYNRQYLRKHYATGIYVSNDGLHAEKDIYDKRVGEHRILTYAIQTDESGRAFIYDTYLQTRLYLDNLVISCYRGQAPKDGKTYYPYHKDGNMFNSHISNLEWKEETPESIAAYTQKEKEAWFKNRKISVNKKGIIKQGGRELNLIDYMYDPDLDWTYHYPKPWVRYEEKNKWGNYSYGRIEADKVFEDLGLVNGDKSLFPTPVILHRNHDYMDYRADNLEWVDANDPRYVEFAKIRHEAVMQKDHDSNCRLDEGSWNVIYHGKEPYQDWSDRPEKKLMRFI